MTLRRSSSKQRPSLVLSASFGQCAGERFFRTYSTSSAFAMLPSSRTIAMLVMATRFLLATSSACADSADGAVTDVEKAQGALESHMADANHGDVCRMRESSSFFCPVGCTHVDEAPHCVAGDSDLSRVPCRAQHWERAALDSTANASSRQQPERVLFSVGVYETPPFVAVFVANFLAHTVNTSVLVVHLSGNLENETRLSWDRLIWSADFSSWRVRDDDAATTTKTDVAAADLVALRYLATVAREPFGRVLLNPEHIRTTWATGTILQMHMSNFAHAVRSFETTATTTTVDDEDGRGSFFTSFMTLAQNTWFVCAGIEAFVGAHRGLSAFGNPQDYPMPYVHALKKSLQLVYHGHICVDCAPFGQCAAHRFPTCHVNLCCS